MLAPVKSEPIVRPERSANCKLFEGIPPLCGEGRVCTGTLVLAFYLSWTN